MKPQTPLLRSIQDRIERPMMVAVNIEIGEVWDIVEDVVELTEP